MRLAIIGSRVVPATAYQLLCDTIRWRFGGNDVLWVDEVISGGAAGVDTLAERWVYETNALFRPFGVVEKVKLTVIRPDYEAYPGRVAPLMRNELIIKAADWVLALHDGVSRGTLNALDHARKHRKPTVIVYV